MCGKPCSQATKDKISKANKGKSRGTTTNRINYEIEKDDVICGLLLSDAHLNRIKNEFCNSHFGLTQSKKNSELIDYVENYFKQLKIHCKRKDYVRTLKYGSFNSKSYDTVNLFTIRYPEFTELRKKWYPNGIKIVPKDLKLTPKMIAWWFMGDGSSRWYERGNKKVTALFSTDGFDIGSVLYLKYQLEELGIKSNIRFYKNHQRPYIEIKKSDMVAKLMTLMKPYVIPCFAYKIKEPYVNSKTGPMPEWMINHNRSKCIIPNCTRSSHKNLKGCKNHKSAK